MMATRRWFFSGLILMAPPVLALEVLHDAGNTRPLAPLLQQAGLLAGDDPPPPSPQGPPPDRFRITTPGLTPGVQPRIPVGPLARPLPRPVFLVGADPRSLAWLRRHRERLRALGAVGLIVEAGGAGEVDRVRQAGAGLAMALGSGVMLRDLFNLRHYPVLIGNQWIEQ